MNNDSFGTSAHQRQRGSDREQGVQRPSESATLDLIETKHQESNFDAFGLMRLVTYLIVKLLNRMLRLGCTVEEAYVRHSLFECIKPLRALGRSIIDTHKLRKKADVILWEGEAIKKVGDAMLGWFVEAMTQAKLTDFEQQIVMRNYRDLAAMNEPELRRETER